MKILQSADAHSTIFVIQFLSRFLTDKKDERTKNKKHSSIQLQVIGSGEGVFAIGRQNFDRTGGHYVTLRRETHWAANRLGENASNIVLKARDFHFDR